MITCLSNFLFMKIEISRSLVWPSGVVNYISGCDLVDLIQNSALVLYIYAPLTGCKFFSVPNYSVAGLCTKPYPYIV